MTRDEKQLQIHNRFLSPEFNGRGYLQACTGFGKTVVAINAIRHHNVKRSHLPIHVVVPTTPLKKQWESITQKLKMYNVEVFTVNTYTKVARSCSFLIGDEAHWYSNEDAEVFSKVFGQTECKFVLPLSATLSEEEQMFLERNGIKQLDNIPIEMARRNGWVSDYEEYNLGIELNEVDREYYDNLNVRFTDMFTKFDHDFDTMLRASYGNKPVWYKADANSKGVWLEPAPVKIARQFGWIGNPLAKAVYEQNMNKTRGRGQKVNIWGGDLDHPYHPDKIVGYAVQGMKLMRERKEFLHKCSAKLEIVRHLLHSFTGKAICFGETTEFADRIAEMMGEEAIAYHSNLQPVEREIVYEKEYKSRTSVENFIIKNPELKAVLKEKNGKFIARYKKKKKFGTKTLREEALRKIRDNRFKIRIISTAKALDEGFDQPDLEIGIIWSRTSNPRKAQQRLGRIARLFEKKDGSAKKAIMINIYIKGTKDEHWLRESQKKSFGVKWISSIEEIGKDEFRLN